MNSKDLIIPRKYNISLSRIQVLLAEWVLIAVLLLYPVFASISISLGVSSTPLSMTYRAGYLGLSLFVLFIEMTNKNKKTIPIFVLFIFLFWIVYLGRLIYHFGIIGGRGYAGHDFIFYFQQGILGSMIPALAVGIVSKRLNYIRLFNNIKIVAMFTAVSLIYIVGTEVGFSMEIYTMRLGFGEDGGVIGPIIMSQYGGFVAFIFFYSLIHKGFRILDFVFFFLGMGLLVLGASRGPILSFFIANLVYFIYQMKIRFKNIHFWKYVIIFIAALSIFIIKYVIPNIDKFMILRRLDTSKEVDYGGEVRSYQWTSAWNQFLEHPLLGDNIVEKAFNFYPHNSVLEILMSTGILGFSFYLFAMLKFGYSFLIIKNIEIRFFIYSMILFLFYSLFSLSVIDISQFWCLFSLGVGVVILKIKPLILLNPIHNKVSS